MLLARAVYAVARDESYEAKLAVASAALNRVDDPWHPNTLEGVLNEKHQFPIGNYYDADSLRAAHEALAGRRTLPSGVMYFQAVDAQEMCIRDRVRPARVPHHVAQVLHHGVGGGELARALAEEVLHAHIFALSLIHI